MMKKDSNTVNHQDNIWPSKNLNNISPKPLKAPLIKNKLKNLNNIPNLSIIKDKFQNLYTIPHHPIHSANSLDPKELKKKHIVAREAVATTNKIKVILTKDPKMVAIQVNLVFIQHNQDQNSK